MVTFSTILKLRTILIRTVSAVGESTTHERKTYVHNWAPIIKKSFPSSRLLHSVFEPERCIFVYLYLDLQHLFQLPKDTKFVSVLILTLQQCREDRDINSQFDYCSEFHFVILLFLQEVFYICKHSTICKKYKAIFPKKQCSFDQVFPR